MTLKTSFPTRKNEFRQTFRWTLKKNIGMMSLLTALMFVCLPMVLMLYLTNSNRYAGPARSEAVWRNSIASQYAGFLRFMIPAAALSLMLLFSIILCVRLFGYMQNRRSEDLFHALPVGRIPMLLGRWCAGMVALALPALVNFGVLALIAFAYRIPLYAGGMYIGTALSWLLLMTAAAFAFLTFLSICSGSVMDTILSALGVNVGYPVVVFLGLTLIQSTLPGVGIVTNYDFAVLSLLAPYLAGYVPFMGQQELPVWFLPWWICAALALLAGSCLLYARRKSESAEDHFAFQAPKIAIRFLLTACGGLGLGMIGVWTGTENIVTFLLFVVTGSLVAHVVVEAIYSRGFRGMKRSLRWYAVFAVCFAALYGVLATGCFGFDSRIPDSASIKSVSVDMNGYTGGGNCVYKGKNYGPSVRLEPVLKKPDNVRTVLQFHRELAAKYRAEKFPYVPLRSVGGSLTLNYHLKNGTTFTREFRLPPDFYESEWEEKREDSIIRLDEYRENSDIIFFLKSEDIKSVILYPKDGEGKAEYFLRVTDSDLRSELIDAIREEYSDAVMRIRNGREINSDRGYQLALSFREPIRPGARLQEAIGGYSGLVTVGEPAYFYRKDGKVARVLKQIEARDKKYGDVEKSVPSE